METPSTESATVGSLVLESRDDQERVLGGHTMVCKSDVQGAMNISTI